MRGHYADSIYGLKARNATKRVFEQPMTAIESAFHTREWVIFPDHTSANMYSIDAAGGD